MTREEDFTGHPIADGRDAWRCFACEQIFYDDNAVVQHPQKPTDVLCLNCFNEIETE